MEFTNISKWAELLLDLGKGNNLINFKSSSTRSLEILLPDIFTIFKECTKATCFEVYDPLTEIDDNITVSSSKELEEELLTKEAYITKYKKLLKRNQILVYNSSLKPLQALKNISRLSSCALLETGVNILYLSIGFINWYDKDSKNTLMKAPLILIPVSIIHESFVDPYVIKVLDDDIIVNPTFSYKLESEYNITLPSFNEDNSLEDYLNDVEALLSRVSMSISRVCKLGIFSFQKLNMYQDLKENLSIISKSETVKCLLEGSGYYNQESLKFSDKKLLNVVDADGSQRDAILMAKNKMSFVLQGPPGTGKSQTITNIIAEAISDGRTVLFVSEKLAALSVVYDKLKKASLDEFCLELHSHKASKKQVIDELYHTLIKDKSSVSSKAYNELDILKKAKEELDLYTEELHKKRDVINKSLYELINDSISHKAGIIIPLVINNIEDKDTAYLDQVVSYLKRYSDLVPNTSYDYHDFAWYGYKIKDVRYQSKLLLQENLTIGISLLEDLEYSISLYSKYFLTNNLSLNDIIKLQEIVKFIINSNYLSIIHFNKKKLLSAKKILSELLPVVSKLKEKKNILDNKYDDKIYNLDGSKYFKLFETKYTNILNRIFSKEYKEISHTLKLLTKESKLKFCDMLKDLNTLSIYQDNLLKYNKLIINNELLGIGFTGIDSEFDKILSELDGFEKLSPFEFNLTYFIDKSQEEFDDIKTRLKTLYDDTLVILDNRVSIVLKLEDDFDKDIINLTEDNTCKVLSKLKECLNSFDLLDSYSELDELLYDIKNDGLLNLLDKLLSFKISPDNLVSTYSLAFYNQWIDYILYEVPFIKRFKRSNHDDVVKTFIEKDTLNLEINKAIVKEIVSSKRPSIDMIAPSSSIAILKREAEKKRKQKSIRNLLSEIKDLALLIKPCFLMSPLSVSTYLSPSMHFDLVIFDEASQIFPEDSIGAIYRGSQLIVVGDSMQMPPTNFFKSTSNALEDEEKESVKDYESILDLCSITLPSRRLKWHYRSRYEELIAFSNNHFYDNDLVTFPEGLSKRESCGVKYQYVDGIFDRTSKTNLEEARKVVEIVFSNIINFPNRSMGVVAFSVSQQLLIEKLILNERKNNPSLEYYFRSDKEEPFFVKNLETVQGDERDTIIFSIAYAKDESGKLLLNFGPLNKLGGERRLNVAITRSKVLLVLVASINYFDIDLSRTTSLGTKLLYEYLKYASSNQSLNLLKESGSSFQDSDMVIDEIKEFITDLGYEVEQNVGKSLNRIDLAIKEKGSNDYILAIECDGNNYNMLKDTSDRDRLRPKVLKNLGWRLYRMWSIDWYLDKVSEKERLLKVLSKSSNSKEILNTALNKKVTYQEKAINSTFCFPKYLEVDELVDARKCKYNVLNTVLYILEEEAPVSYEQLVKRLSFLYGKEKVSSALYKAFDNDIKECINTTIDIKNGFIYLKNKQIPLLRVPEKSVIRDIKYIAKEELANGLFELIKHNVSVDKNGLYRLLVSYLGYIRVGDAMISKLDEALLTLNGKLEITGNIISIKK